jgi:hypothetical protein
MELDPRDWRDVTRRTNPIPADTIEPPVPHGVWSVDRERGEIGFAVKEMWGLRTVRGVFRAYDGSLNLERAAPRAS